MPVEAEISWWKAAGVDRVGLLNLRRVGGEWRPDAHAVLRAGLEIAYLTHARMFVLDDRSTWAECSDALVHSVDSAVELGVGTIYTTTGPKGTLTFEDAVDALDEAYAPVGSYAESQGVAMLVETANQLFAHTHFLHTLVETTAVARRVGMGVCLDVHATWTESSLEPRLLDAAPLIGLVQISDFIPGLLTISRMRWWISSTAPTSTPCVGSSRISTRGLTCMHRARMTFCWFPPLSVSTPPSGVAL